MADCPHGMPSPASCIDCMNDGPVSAPASWARVGDLFIAKFDADCADVHCTRRIDAGTSIARWDYGAERTVYTHAGCRPQ